MSPEEQKIAEECEAAWAWHDERERELQQRCAWAEIVPDDELGMD